ncbi:MAG: AbrB/MazE/SpoVT family DNA-binding domain-containing protein [bacterium]
MGKRGTLVVPAMLRQQYGLDEGVLVITETRDDGILLKPATAVPTEIYTPQRKAEFLLSTAVDADDYQSARQEVEKLGIDPDTVPHHKPEGV